MPIQLLSWDTAFFGFKTGRAFDADVAAMDLHGLHHHIREAQYRLVYFMAPGQQLPERQQAAEPMRGLMQQAGATLADRKVTYTKAVNPCLKNFQSQHIAPERSIPVSERLQALALQAGQHSRFRTDPRFPEHLFQRLYLEWLLKSLTGELASGVLVWLDDYRNIQGFITLKHHGGFSEIGLIAVDEAARGRQVGTTLLKAAEASAALAGNTRINVATQQQNTAACTFYEKYGYQTHDITEVWHWWE
jgi:dTDP-4-amino-4,6-dideoxy-D-galactose acyltransferase